MLGDSGCSWSKGGTSVLNHKIRDFRPPLPVLWALLFLENTQKANFKYRKVGLLTELVGFLGSVAECSVSTVPGGWQSGLNKRVFHQHCS